MEERRRSSGRVDDGKLEGREGYTGRITRLTWSASIHTQIQPIPPELSVQQDIEDFDLVQAIRLATEHETRQVPCRGASRDADGRRCMFVEQQSYDSPILTSGV